jgi:hypothetical protein
MRRREARRSSVPVESKPAQQPKAAPPKRRTPSELERIEGEIAERESVVADLERRLAEDWNDVAVLAAHRRARDELQSLLERWEKLFEKASR